MYQYDKPWKHDFLRISSMLTSCAVNIRKFHTLGNDDSLVQSTKSNYGPFLQRTMKGGFESID